MKSFIASSLPRITALRHHIHAHPELAFKEHSTAAHIVAFMKGLSNPPDIVQDIGGTGFLAIFDFNHNAQGGGSRSYANSNANTTIVFRSELDAVPVHELNGPAMPHASTHEGVSHKCGHDGHMAILAGLAMLLSDLYRPSSGKVVLLFQPAEETGAGARRMVDAHNPVLEAILAEANTSIFALHNVPGFPRGAIVLPRTASFASASKGMHVKLGGCTCHASQPHLGRNPALAMCNIVQGLLAMPSLHVPYDQKAIVTVVGARTGEKAFGVSAGDAEVMATLRSTTDAGMDILVKNATQLVTGIAATYGLKCSVDYEDDFAATVNSAVCVAQVQEAAGQCGFETVWMDQAFPWSEDFGVFTKRAKGAMFGLGMGLDYEPLHGEYYDFPDSELANGVLVFAAIMMNALAQRRAAA